MVQGNGMACVIEEDAKTLDFPLPTAEEAHHFRKVAKVADEITGERLLEICLSDGPEETPIRQLAEQKVKRDESQGALPPRRVQRALPPKKHTAIVGQASYRN